MGIYGEDHIHITNSNSSLSKMFPVAYPNWQMELEATQEIIKLAGGGIDVVEGAVYETHHYTLWVPYANPPSGYGTLDDLKTFFNTRTPNGTPNNKLTLVDNFGNSHTVFMVGKFSFNALTTMIEGNSAFFLCPVDFLVLSTP